MKTYKQFLESVLKEKNEDEVELDGKESKKKEKPKGNAKVVFHTGDEEELNQSEEEESNKEK